MFFNTPLNSSALSTMWVSKGKLLQVVPSPWKIHVSPKREQRGRGSDTRARMSDCSLTATMLQHHHVPAAQLIPRQQLVEESCNLWVRDFRPRFSAFGLQINNAFLTFQVHRQNILSSSRLLTSCAEEIYYSLRN